MNEFHTKMIERETRAIVKNMRSAGIVIDKEHYKEILNDLTEIALVEVGVGRSPIGWLYHDHQD